MEDLILEIAKQLPSIGILVYFIMYFQKEIQRKDDELRATEKELRATEKESIRTMDRLITVINDLKELIKDKLKNEN